MNLELSHVGLIGIGYLLVLFGIAFVTERGWLPQWIVRHPVTYILSLGIFGSAWSFYGIIDLASRFGYGTLIYYLGTGAFFLFSPIIQAPLAKLSQRFQLRSVADLLVFRFPSEGVGKLTALCMLLAVVPLLCLQIQAVAETSELLTLAGSKLSSHATGLNSWFNQRDTIALLYCILIAVFCMTYGVNRKHQTGFITAMAFGSLIKVCTLFTVGLFAVYGVFDGFDGLDQWLVDNPEHLKVLHQPAEYKTYHALLLVFIAIGVLMPHVFQMNYVNSSIDATARTISWAFPLFLLFMALPIFPILWAGLKLEVPLAVEYFTIGVPLVADAKLITLMTYIGGLSAASGAFMVSILAVSTMVLNHWLLPYLNLKNRENFYSQLRFLYRLIIITLSMGSFIIYMMLNDRYSMLDLALLTFIQALQFVPGIIAINHWPRANHYGFLSGLSVGTLIWFIGLVLPIITGNDSFSWPWINIEISAGMSHWYTISALSLGFNIVTFCAVSLLTTMSDEEHYSAELCALNELSHPIRMILDVHNVREFKQQLAKVLGETAANTEVERALNYLQLNNSERRPYSLRRLRNRLETNLSALMGQNMASGIMHTLFPYKLPKNRGLTDINLIESRLDGLSHNLSGITADVNQLRLHYRNTLKELPIAVCSLGPDNEILLWNKAMTELTGIASEDITGSHLHNVPLPWGDLIDNFVNNYQDPIYNKRSINKTFVDDDGDTHWYRLHKSLIQHSSLQSTDGYVVLIENITEIQLLEQRLAHNERLASIGRLAAGVAHEIGNPVTGIACLAQNLDYETDLEEQRQTAKQILSQTDRIDRIVQSLVNFAHSGKPDGNNFHSVDICQVVDEAIHLLSLQKYPVYVQFINDVDRDIYVLGDNQRLIQVFINLLANARDASTENGKITVSTDKDDQFVYIYLVDEGEGIAPEHIDKVLEPFFTTKEAGQGTGLGLSLVYSIIKEHNGSIEIKTPVSNNRGSCFVLKLPIYHEAIRISQ